MHMYIRIKLNTRKNIHLYILIKLNARVVTVIEMNLFVLLAVVKLILYLICRRIQNPSVQALAKDHFNDVISNTGAVACGIIGMCIISIGLQQLLCVAPSVNQ